MEHSLNSPNTSWYTSLGTIGNLRKLLSPQKEQKSNQRTKPSTLVSYLTKASGTRHINNMPSRKGPQQPWHWAALEKPTGVLHTHRSDSFSRQRLQQGWTMPP